MPTDIKTSPNFSDFYSLEVASAHFDHARRFWQDQASPDYISALRSNSEQQQNAIGTFLTSLRDAGQLTEVPFATRRGHRWAAPWNRFVNHTEHPWDLGAIAGLIARAVDWTMSRSLAFENRQGLDNAQLYSELVQMMNAGSFSPLDLGDDARDFCNVTGQRLAIQITPGWKPLLGEITLRPRAFTPVTCDCPAPTVISHEIPAPSGELLVADWFRLGDNLFSEIVDPIRHKFEISYAFGRAQQTAHYAKEFGFMSVEAGNSSPEILERKDHLLVGIVNEETRVTPSGVFKGRVCTDLWWVSMIDKQVLIDLVARKLGPDAAKVTVDAYVASALASSDINVLKVEPGTVHFHFTANRQDLANFQCEGPLDVDFHSVEPFLIVSTVPLVWKPRETAQLEGERDPEAPCPRP